MKIAGEFLPRRPQRVWPKICTVNSVLLITLILLVSPGAPSLAADSQDDALVSILQLLETNIATRTTEQDRDLGYDHFVDQVFLEETLYGFAAINI